MTSNYARAVALAKNSELVMAEGRMVYAGSLALGHLFATLALVDEIKGLREQIIPPKDAP